MGWGFRWRIKILPGVAVNVSKSGFSLSLGSAPFTVNLRPDRIRSTISAPGTGLSYRADFVAPSETQRREKVEPVEPTEIDMPLTDPHWKPITPLEGYRFRNPPPPLSELDLRPSADPAVAAPPETDSSRDPLAGHHALWPVALLVATACLGWLWLRAGTDPGPDRSTPGDISVHRSDEVPAMMPIPIDVPIPRPRPTVKRHRTVK